MHLLLGNIESLKGSGLPHFVSSLTGKDEVYNKCRIN